MPVDRAVVPAEPVRTCVGCRQREVWSALVRVAVATAPQQLDRASGKAVLVPDPGRTMPGRGAWIHPCPDCLQQAIRRRAFVRALRLQGSADVSAVAAWLEDRGIGSS